MSLKTKNLPLIVSYIIANLAIYAAFLLGLDNFEQNFSNIFSKFNAKNGFVISIAPILSIILTGFVNSHWKAIFVFWRFNHPLPGCRVFSELASNDCRINIDAIKTKIGYLPTRPEEQNQIWYKYSKIYGDRVSVNSSHRHYLLMRDLTSIAVISVFPLSIAIGITRDNFSLAFTYFLLWILQYLVLAKVAKNFGERFVCNVLAELSSECELQKK